MQRKGQLQIRTHLSLRVSDPQGLRKASPRGHSSRHCPAKACQLRRLHYHPYPAPHLHCLQQDQQALHRLLSLKLRLKRNTSEESTLSWPISIQGSQHDGVQSARAA